MPALGRVRRARRRPAFLRMLAGILVAYALIIGYGDNPTGGAARIVLFGFLLGSAMRLRGVAGWWWWALGLTAAVLTATIWAEASASDEVASGVVGAASLVLIVAVVVTIASTLAERFTVDTATVLGVLCIYLLLAILFASLHQLLASFGPGYLSGVSDPPSASDLLYFSVITMTTVGYGDILPASQAARAVAVTEALIGQLYLVSVVAAVVAGWRATGRSQT